MTAALPIKHKPFNLEHAKAGAPYATRDGNVATILKWDGRHSIYPLLGMAGDDDYMTCWTAAGKYEPERGDQKSDLVMTPLGYIDGKPVFVGDEVLWGDELMKARPTWKKCDMADCRWPAPAKAYPTFDGSVDMLAIAYNKSNHFAICLHDVANAALRHAVDTGRVVTEAEHLCAIGIIQAKLYRAERALTRAGFEDRGGQEWAPPIGKKPAYIRDADRDMAIAKAVLNECETAVEPYFRDRSGVDTKVVFKIDLAAIIAKVPT